MELIRGISGIRGIVGLTLTAHDVEKYSFAFAKLQPMGTILLARDSRTHGRSLLLSAYNALITSGREVIDCDIIPTPTAQFIVQQKNLAGAIVITASHNPSEWNGMKFVDHDGCFLDGNANKTLFNIADELPDYPALPQDDSTIDSHLPEEHISHSATLTTINRERIASRKFKVVVDAVNGAASILLPEVLRQLGCEVIPLYCTPDGQFPRGTEPLPINLKDLGHQVRKHGADVGFATDPDGDRLAVVDERGDPLGEEYTLTICADGFLAENPSQKPIVTNLSTTMALDRVAEKYDVPVIRTAVGEINVVNAMKAHQSVLGGEGNGGVILAESHLGRDSLVGVALFLNRMSQTTDPVSIIFKSMPQFTMVKDKIQLGDINPDQVIEKISKQFGDVEQDHQDGLKLIWQDCWVHIRKSNTEPIVRIYAEAETPKNVQLLVEEIKKLV